MSEKDIQEAMKHENKLGAGAKKRKKLKAQDKIATVMKEHAKGTLHSGSGEIVKDPKQALAIAYSEARKRGLTKSLGTSLSSTTRFILSKVPGQVPDRDTIETIRIAKEEPPKWSVMRLLQHDGTYLSPQSVVDGIGLNPAQQNLWVKHLKESSGNNELIFRQSIMSKMLNDRMDQATRQALFQRSMKYYRDMKKSMVEVLGVDDLKKSEELDDRLFKSIHRRVRKSGGVGLHLSKLSDLVSSYGRKAVAEVLEKACNTGSLQFRKGVLLYR